MLRQLLAILALVTGLAAVAEPVQAARAGASSVQTVSELATAACRKPTVVVRIAGDERAVRDRSERGCASAPDTAVVPTIRLRADRARE